MKRQWKNKMTEEKLELVLFWSLKPAQVQQVRKDRFLVNVVAASTLLKGEEESLWSFCIKGDFPVVVFFL